MKFPSITVFSSNTSAKAISQKLHLRGLSEAEHQAFHGLALGDGLVGDGDTRLGHDLVDRGRDDPLAKVVEAFVAVPQVQEDA